MSKELLYAATDNNVEKLNQILIENKENISFSIDYKNTGGSTALIKACKEGKYEAAEYLIANGANVNAKNMSGRTALIYAALNDNVKIAELLIKNGADLNIQAKSGEKSREDNNETALLTALYKTERRRTGQTWVETRGSRVFDMILKAKPDLELKNSHGHTVLFDTIIWHNFKKAEDLIIAGAKTDDLFKINSIDMTMYMYFEKNNIKTYEITIREYIDAHIKDQQFAKLASLIEKVELEKLIELTVEVEPFQSLGSSSTTPLPAQSTPRILTKAEQEHAVLMAMLDDDDPNVEPDDIDKKIDRTEAKVRKQFVAEQDYDRAMGL